MKIDNRKVFIPEVEIENVEDELVVYSQKSKKIIVFNKAASIVWKKIKATYDEDAIISMEEIRDELLKCFNTAEVGKEQIFDDVVQIVDQFFKEGLLVQIE